jgi:predicted nucleic acid-binding protein
MKFLVDANVLSESTKSKPTPSVLDWLARHETQLAVNPIILGELQYGILLLPSGRRRTRLLQWFTVGVKHLPVLDLDANTAKVWAELIARLKRKGHSIPVKDSLIAATAFQYRLAVVTRNVNDFGRTGVKVVNPFTG